MSYAQVHHTGSVHIDLPPDQTFPLFTAAGEKLWIDGWEPVMMTGENGQSRGTVFTTSVGGELTIWTVIESCEARGRLLYSRVAPASRAGLVEVVLAAEGAGTRVEIDYALTALTEQGNAILGEFDHQAFATMLSMWNEKLSRFAEPALA